jgi:hypothetical protein
MSTYSSVRRLAPPKDGPIRTLPCSHSMPDRHSFSRTPHLQRRERVVGDLVDAVVIHRQPQGSPEQAGHLIDVSEVITRLFLTERTPPQVTSYLATGERRPAALSRPAAGTPERRCLLTATDAPRECRPVNKAATRLARR